MTSPEHRVATPAEGLAIEAKLLAASQAMVRVWSSDTTAIVCPKSLSRKDGFAGAARSSQSQGWPVHLRGSGGGVVPQGPGVLNLSLAITTQQGFTIEAGYRLLSDTIRRAFGPHSQQLKSGDTPGSFCDGTWNLMIGGRKVAGLAQHWRALRGGDKRVLAHAMILLDGDITQSAWVVNRFHDELGLAPVRACAHTTLKQSMDQTDPRSDFAEKLFTAAQIVLAMQASSTPTVAAA